MFLILRIGSAYKVNNKWKDGTSFAKKINSAESSVKLAALYTVFLEVLSCHMNHEWSVDFRNHKYVPYFAYSFYCDKEKKKKKCFEWFTSSKLSAKREKLSGLMKVDRCKLLNATCQNLKSAYHLHSKAG